MTTIATRSPEVRQMLRTTSATVPAYQLRRALRAACAPLHGVGARAQKHGRIWVQISDGGQLRFTTQWHRQWARAYAHPLSLQTPPDAPTPARAITLEGAQRLAGFLSMRRFDATTPARARLDLHGLHVLTLDTHVHHGVHAEHRAADGQTESPGPFPLPLPLPLPGTTAALPGDALADLVGARRAGLTQSPARLYPVPDQPGLTAWTLGDWAHGQAYVPPAGRQDPADVLEALAARERGTA